MAERDDLHGRVDRHLDLILRRGGTGVPGTVSLIRDLLATVDAERAARERAEQQLAAITADEVYDYLDVKIGTSGSPPNTYRIGQVLDAVRALLDATTTDTPCPTCGDKGIVPHTGRGEDGYDPCPDCGPDAPEGP